MQYWEILILSVALAMDACAVAMTNGMSDNKIKVKKALLIGAFFGFFQFLMPLIGFFITGFIADNFLEIFEILSAWISFALLAFLGIKMLTDGIKEYREKCKFCQEVEKIQKENAALPIGKLFLQAIATSIDALAVGVTLKMAALSPAGLVSGEWGATLTIGVITFVLSVISVYIGKAIGNKLTDKAGMFGGAVLLLIGLKILLESFL